MIYLRKAQKRDKEMLIRHKLLTIIPYIDDNTEKLAAIKYVNNYINNFYDKAYLIYYNFKKVGSLIIDNQKLELLYIESPYQNHKIGYKVIKKYQKEIKEIKLKAKNVYALKFYQQIGYTKKITKDDMIILRKEKSHAN